MIPRISYSLGPRGERRQRLGAARRDPALSRIALRGASHSFANALVNVGWRNGLVEEIHVGEPQGYPIEAETADPTAECEKKDAFPPHRGASVSKAILVVAVETTGAAVSRLLHARALWLARFVRFDAMTGSAWSRKAPSSRPFDPKRETGDEP